MKSVLNAAIIIAIITPNVLLSQIPKDVPHPVNNSPIDLSEPADIVLYIILPILCIVFYIIWRKKKKNDKNNVK